MSNYDKGRYDELLERYKGFQQMYEKLFWEFSTSLHTGKISGAQVHYYAGIRVDPSTVGLIIGGGGIAFSVLSYFLGLTPPTFGVTILVFGFLYSLISHLKKKPLEKQESLVSRLN